MTRIVLLSDLHFGAHDPALIGPLLSAVRAQAPDVTVVAGDFAQRGTTGQWRQARDFVAALPDPVFCVPGNHDIPHFNPLLRAIDPYGRYRRATGSAEEPVWSDADTLVAGINTADRWQWMRGKVSPPHVDGLRQRLGDAGGRLRIAVMHHPLEHAAVTVDPLMRGAGMLLGALPGMGARIVLSGHIHVSHVAPFRDAPGILFVQNGTSLSTRRRGEANVFLTLVTGPGTVRITRHYAAGDGFVATAPEDWAHDGAEWQPEAAPARRLQLPR
ncbi:MAG: metallophosphoesterase [Rhodobacteraceae bacterium]|nr:metallophosphoesterase [Paracoccaceae bacterium]